MFNIKLEVKSHKMSFKALLLKKTAVKKIWNSKFFGEIKENLLKLRNFFCF